MYQTCNVSYTGFIEYQTAWRLQKRLVRERSADRINDTLLIVEHPHTYTLGRAGDASNLLLSAEQLAAQQIAYVPIDRGGDITYHGPGQLVAYPILHLKQRHTGEGRMKADFIQYIRDLEEILIRTVADYEITSQREEGLTGVWVGTADDLAKIAAIGIKISSKGVSSHGIALNVTTDLSFFDGIVPCGIDDKTVTSVRELVDGNPPSLKETAAHFEAHFADVLCYSLVPLSFEQLLEHTHTQFE